MKCGTTSIGPSLSNMVLCFYLGGLRVVVLIQPSMRTSMEASCFYHVMLAGVTELVFVTVCFDYFFRVEIMLLDVQSRLCACVHSFVQRDVVNVTRNRWLFCIVS